MTASFKKKTSLKSNFQKSAISSLRIRQKWYGHGRTWVQLVKWTMGIMTFMIASCCTLESKLSSDYLLTDEAEISETTRDCYFANERYSFTGTFYFQCLSKIKSLLHECFKNPFNLTTNLSSYSPWISSLIKWSDFKRLINSARII